jgi:hypothetical protein
MTRRRFTAASAGTLLAAQAQDKASPAIFELRYFYLRNTLENQAQRTNEFLEKAHLPALARSGATATAVFNGNIGQDTPCVLVLSQYPTVAAWEQAQAKLAADQSFTTAADKFHSLPGLGYVRMKTSLLRAFRTVPSIEIPKQEKDRAPRVFELRTYESNNPATLARKIGMFDNGEVAIFRRLNMTPVFFGETILGDHMPNLTYMLCYDSLAMREKVWNDFRKDPEWAKLSGTPGLSNAEIVSNISVSLLSPAAYSAIR